MRHLLSPAISHAAAAKREHHLNRALELDQEAEQAEAFAEARRFIRNPGDDHPHHADHRTAYLRGVAAKLRAQRLRTEIQLHLIRVTDLTDYDDDAHLDPGWLSRALTAAADCRPSHYDPAGVSGRWAGQRAA